MLKLGVRGSALATIVSQTVCSIWILLYFRGNKSFLIFKLNGVRIAGPVLDFISSVITYENKKLFDTLFG